MTDTILAADQAASRSGPITAGGLLRQARQAQGLHIAALAASIKVTPAKLEALESDQFSALPDATFTRALAQTVCRSLKIDPVPVLALLPPPNGHRLEEVAEGLKTPFNERPGRLVPGQWLKLSGPTMWVAAALVIGAVVLYVMPAGWVGIPRVGPMHAASSADAPVVVQEPLPPGAEPATVEPAAAGASDTSATAGEPSGAGVSPGSGGTQGGSATASAGATSMATLPATSPSTGTSTATSTGGASAVAGKALELRTSAPAWIGVNDAAGKALIGRLVQPGENIDIDGSMPMTLRIGNANTVHLTLRGQPVDLAKYTRDNVARLQLK